MNKPQTLKGFRDFLPAEVRKRRYVIGTLREVFELYGFEPLETPTLEYAEVLTGKYGSEADRLLYTFLDRGGRKIGMRYDQTVPLARVVAQYQNELPFPFKRYQIQPVWRAENTQKGRYREFVQCDIDTVGTKSPLADAEVLAIATKAYERLGFPLTKVNIKINNRKNFSGIPTDAITTIDKLDKIGEEGVRAELRAKNHPESLLEELRDKPVDEETRQIIEEYYPLLIGDNRISITYAPTLARGLDYYTGSIFEVSIEGYSAGSVGGGGRYDNLIGTFAGREIPAVGFAFGFDRLIEAMSEQDLFPREMSETKVLVTIFANEEKLVKKSLETSALLREEGINAELWLDETAKMEKQLKYADQKSIPFAVIIGPDEAEKNVVTLRDMKTRGQKQLSLSDLLDETF